MDDSPYHIVTEVHTKLQKVRDAKQIGDSEQTVLVDVVATLRTLLAMYTPTETEPEKEFSMNDLNPFKRRGV